MKKLLFIQQSVLSLVHYYLYYSGRMSSDSFRRCLISVSLFDIKDQSSFGVGFFIQELNHFTAGKILLRDVNYCFRSEERRVGKEWNYLWVRDRLIEH